MRVNKHIILNELQRILDDDDLWNVFTTDVTDLPSFVQSFDVFGELYKEIGDRPSNVTLREAKKIMEDVTASEAYQEFLGKVLSSLNINLGGL